MRKSKVLHLIEFTPENSIFYEAEAAEIKIKGMPKRDFHRKVVKKICKNPAFGALVTFGAGKLSEKDKVTIRGEFSKIGIPADWTNSDYVLDRIAAAIAARSVRVE